MKSHKDQFFNYLVALNLFPWGIMETDDEFLACVSPDSNPNVSDFTQVYQNTDGTWTVRLSKSDIYSEAITKGFFKPC